MIPVGFPQRPRGAPVIYLGVPVWLSLGFRMVGQPGARMFPWVPAWLSYSRSVAFSQVPVGTRGVPVGSP